MVATPQWIIAEAAERSLAKILNLQPDEAARATRELVGEARPTSSRAQQPGCEIWRASSDWHRLRIVVERVSETELKLHDVLPHANWPPPSTVPAEKAKTPAPAAKTPAAPVAAAPIPAPIVLVSPKNSARSAAAASPPADPPVLVRRRTSAPPDQGEPASSRRPSAMPSIASALSTSQLLALHAVLMDWRRGGVWPGLTKLAGATELPRSQVVALAAEIERLHQAARDAGGQKARETPQLADVRRRIQRAIEQALRPLPATIRREPRLEIEQLVENIYVVTVTADMDTMDAVIEGLGAAKVEGLTERGRHVRALVRVSE